jgi:hypothetical protein
MSSTSTPATAMIRPIIHRCCVYMLIALLPLQAMAMSRMAACGDMTGLAHKSAVPMDNCAQMANMSPSSTKDSSSHHHKTTSCWLGSVCLANVVALAVPMKLSSPAMERSAPAYPSVVTHYRSVILDDLQRPPVIL